MDKEKSCGCIILKNDGVLLIGAKDDDGKLFIKKYCYLWLSH